jgi:3-hydroxyacyl-CoA dehydrogenase/3a,7a,12a-trihydroxy-5b-cholest-24-enoyl-CoA hydratase
MPIDLAKAKSAVLPPFEHRYEEKDVIFYALSVGACAQDPTDPKELSFCYENAPDGLKVLPTFGVVPPFRALAGIFSVPGVEVNPLMILHGEQYLEIRKHPIPTRGVLKTTPRIQNIYDKGKGALILLDTITVDEKGEEVFFNTFSLFARGEGGFGGERGPDPGNEPPNRRPDKVHEEPTAQNQALLYRWNGDLNPLHADPNVAQMVGYPKAILHGLCTFGFVGRAILRHYCDFQPERFRSIKVRFSSHVFPGEALVTEMWQEGKSVIFKARTKERGLDVITNARVELA